MAKNLDDDEYVAELLKQDAKNAAKKYELVGIDAFNPRRANAGAPKLNKNFLRNIIRQTDRHNAALLAKEAEESRARLRTMDRERNRGRARSEEEQDRRTPGRLTPVSGDDDLPKAHSSRRRDYSEDEDKHMRRRRRSKEREASKGATSRRHRDRSRDRKRHKRRYESEEEDRSRQKRRRSRSPYERSNRHKVSDTDDDRRSRRKERDDRRHRRRRSYSTTSQSPSPSPHSGRHERRHRHRGNAPRNISKSPGRKSRRRNHRLSPEQRAASPAYDSDPLEAIVGPLPPPPEPTVRSKGRGAFKSNSMGIESRFSSTYDPSVDVGVGSDNEDDWGDALEALRDRSRWKQQGADRLRAAGFTEEQVKKWERGEEQNEEDVVWKGKGEAREWDRGKVLDEDGDVGLETDFGRLK